MTKKYSINTAKAISETLDGETIIINLETGCYYSMNHPGTAVWNAIAARTPIDATEQSVADFLAFLIAEDLIMESETSSDVTPIKIEGSPKLDKYDDMQEMLLADPIHDVDAIGWPKLKDQE